MVAINSDQREENGNNFDLFRLSRSKKVVDVSDTHLRKLHKQGLLNFYKCGKAVWVSKSELAALIRTGTKAAA